MSLACQGKPNYWIILFSRSSSAARWGSGCSWGCGHGSTGRDKKSLTSPWCRVSRPLLCTFKIRRNWRASEVEQTAYVKSIDIDPPSGSWSCMVRKNGGRSWRAHRECSRGYHVVKISWSASCWGSATWKDWKGERMSTRRLSTQWLGQQGADTSMERYRKCWCMVMFTKLILLHSGTFGGNKFCQAWVGPKGICRGKCPRMQK